MFSITGRSPVVLLCLLPALLAGCGSSFQGPVWGSIQVDNPADAADAVASLRCRGPGLHGEVQTDAEDTRVGADGRFRFLGSFTFPTTERCYVEVRHPRYRAARVELDDTFAQTLPTLKLESWDEFFASGPSEEMHPGTHRSWLESEVRSHFVYTVLWLKNFSSSEQRSFAHYVPDIHRIYRNAIRHGALPWPDAGLRTLLDGIARIEQATGFLYPFHDYVDAILEGDGLRVQEFIDGGVLREVWYRDSRSALYLAAARGHLDVIDVFLAAGEPLNVAGCAAPLLGALSRQKWAAAVKLIRAGADVNVTCRNQPGVGDVLAASARNGNMELLTTFLEVGVPVDARTRRDTTALAEAAAVGRIQVVKMLLAAGADPGVRTADGVLLVDDAVAKGYLDVERALRDGRSAADTQEGGSPGEVITLPWRRGLPVPYRVYSSYGQVTEMAADPAEPGTLWFSTRGGLLRWNPQTGARRVWTRVNGLPSSAVGRLWFDVHGHYLWVATSGGLARLPLDDPDRMETVGDGEPRSSFASGFLGQNRAERVWFWGDNSLYDVHAEASEAIRYSLTKTLFGMAVQPGGTGFFFTDGNRLWRFDLERAERTLMLSAADLAQVEGEGAAGEPELRTLTLDAAKGHLWIGTRRHGVFRLELGSGSIERPLLDTSQLDRCARGKVDQHMHGQVTVAGGTTYVQLERCFGRIDDDNRFLVLRDRITAGPVVDAGGDAWFAATDGVHRIDARRGTSSFPFPPNRIGKPRVTALHVDDDRLFVGVAGAPLVVLDLRQRVFEPVSGVSDVQRLRRVAGRDDLLALGRSRYWWVDKDTLASEPLMLRPPGTPLTPGAEWQDVRDLEYDGSVFWALRDDRRGAAKSRFGLHRLSAQGAKRYDAAGNYSLGELTTLAQDPERPDRLWLVTKRDRRLIDFDKTLATSELLGASASERRSSNLLARASADRRLRALTLKPTQAYDPDVPDLVWELSGSSLLLKRGAKILHRWPSSLPAGTIAVTRAPTTTVWVATGEGLVEYPIRERLDELLSIAEPAIGR